MPNLGSENGIDEFLEGAGAMGRLVLHCRLHFAEGLGEAAGHEHRIVTEAFVATRRPNQDAVDAAFENVTVALGPGKAEGADEMGLARVGRDGAPGLELFFDIAHGQRKILGSTGPARRIDAGIATQCIDTKAGIVRKCREACSLRGMLRLQPGISGKGGFRLLWLRNSKRTRRHCFNAERPKQIVEFRELAGIVGCDNKFPIAQRSNGTR